MNQNRKTKNLMINQEQYIRDLLYENGILSCNVAILLMKVRLYIEDKETTDNNQEDLKIY